MFAARFARVISFDHATNNVENRLAGFAFGKNPFALLEPDY